MPAGFDFADGRRKTMGKKAAKDTEVDLKGILQRLNPNVPAGAEKDGLPRTPRDTNALRQLRVYVNTDPMAKALLAGHIGVGKSTELLSLAQSARDRRHVIQCSIAQNLGVHNTNTLSLLFVVLEASIRSWIAEL